MSYSEQHSRVESIWRGLIALFGADSVVRKFGNTAPPEWATVIGSLKDYELQRGIRRLTFSGKPHVPSLPEFLKLCREVGGDEHADENRRPLLPPPDIPGMDDWEACANRHLLAFVLQNWHDTNRTFNADETALLVAGKKAWAVDMREIHGTDKAPADHGKDWFNQYMQAALVQMKAAA